MTLGAISCPRCKRVIEASEWRETSSDSCPGCGVDLQVQPFPALTEARERLQASSAVLDEESVCFFHSGNRAEVICDGCGRLLCKVCAIGYSGRKLCPSCVTAAQNSPEGVNPKERVLYDKIAISVAVLPLLVWPLTILTAPATLCVAIYGWNKPPSLVQGRKRWPLIVAIIFATAEMVVWGVFIYYLTHRKHR